MDETKRNEHLKMTITTASGSEPAVSRKEGGFDATPGVFNGNSSGASSTISNSIERHKHKSSSGSSHKPSPSSGSKDVSRPKDSATPENQNGFSKPRDHHSSLSSSSKPRDHSSSSREKEKPHGSNSSSHKDNHSSSKPKEHSISSPRSESSSKHKDGSGGSYREGSSSKHKEGDSSVLNKVESISKNRDGYVGDKNRSSDGSKSHLSSSKSSSSSHKDRHHSSSGTRPVSDKAAPRSDGSKSPEKQHHHHRADGQSPSDLNKSSRVSSPMKVKSETTSPSKSQESKVTAKREDDDDAPLFDRLQNASSSSSGRRPIPVKPEPEDDDDAPLLSRLQKTKLKFGRDDDDVPLMARLDTVKTEEKPVKKRKRDDSGDESDEPLSARIAKVKKIKTEEKSSKRRRHEDDDFAPKKSGSKRPSMKEEQESPKKGRKKQDADATDEMKWKWWEENQRDEGVKWNTLEHKGPIFAAAYEPVPSHVKFYYEGKVLQLSKNAEEVATFYARMLDHDYTTRDLFNSNFFKDWKKVMTSKERELITDLRKCNFKEMDAYFKQKSEEKKSMSKEEKLAIKKENEKLQKEYGFCIIDGHKQKIGNFKIEPPGLFRGRGDHPKQGMLKKRTQPEDVILNCSKGSKVPIPPPGHKWKEVRHDNTVTWLASWSENIQGSIKYIMLNAASKLKGEKDWMKYETARRLHKCVDRIRRNYREDWKSKEMKIRQRAVALYFIDKLALRAGNEKDEDTADTVGCCSLRVEHVKLHEELNGQEFVVEFDFLGKDSIRYYNSVAIEKRVFKNLQLFMENKQDGDNLFDRLNTTILNKHLQSLMDGLTAKVFRTFNASRTLQDQLDLLTSPDDSIPAKLLSYNRANRAVAVLCNHQRAAPKNFDKQMENLQVKIDAKKDAIKAAKKEVKDAKADCKAKRSESAKSVVAKRERTLERLKEQLTKLEVQATDKDENKEIALSTSKLNYLDPRISVAWCKKWDVPIEKVYNKTQRDKFAWAIDMADKAYHF